MGSADNQSYVAGEKGRNRVRAFEKSNSSNLYLEFSERDPKTGEWQKRRISAQTSDKAEAKRKADQLAAKWADGRTSESEETREEITVSTLFDRFLRRRAPQLREDRVRYYGQMRDLFCRYFGPEREAASLNREDWDRFIRDRRSGAIGPRGEEIDTPEDQTGLSPNTVKKNLKALRTVLNWGVGADLLGVNPTDGYPFPTDNNPDQPRLSQERYEAMLEVASEVDWRFELALVLANETGHRIGAIRKLRWPNVNLEADRIRWRGEDDKIGQDHVTPVTDAARSALKSAHAERAGGGETCWVFPAPKDDTQPCSRPLMRDWWLRAEDRAGLEHVEGLGWHGLRRKWVDEHQHVPNEVLADLGGWQTARTIDEVYQSPNMDAMRRAQQERETLREEAMADLN